MYQCHKYGFKLSTTEFNRVFRTASVIPAARKPFEINYSEMPNKRGGGYNHSRLLMKQACKIQIVMLPPGSRQHKVIPVSLGLTGTSFKLLGKYLFGSHVT